MVEVLVTSLTDEFNQQLTSFFKRKELFVLAVCGAACILGIPCVMQVQTVILDGCEPNYDPTVRSFVSLTCCSKECVSVQVGIYVFQLMDHYTAIVSIMFLAFFEVIAICWIYGEKTCSVVSFFQWPVSVTVHLTPKVDTS